MENAAKFISKLGSDFGSGLLAGNQISVGERHFGGPQSAIRHHYKRLRFAFLALTDERDTNPATRHFYSEMACRQRCRKEGICPARIILSVLKTALRNTHFGTG